jgi:hypothetical protein
MMEEGAEEIVAGEPESLLEKGLGHHDFIRVRGRNILTLGR